MLATPGTVSREYTHALIHTYASHCKVFLHGAKRLAEIAENKLKGRSVDLDELRREIAPVFRKRDGRSTDVVVLGCTHYPLLVEEMAKVAALARHATSTRRPPSPGAWRTCSTRRRGRRRWA